MIRTSLATLSAAFFSVGDAPARLPGFFPFPHAQHVAEDVRNLALDCARPEAVLTLVLWKVAPEGLFQALFFAASSEDVSL